MDDALAATAAVSLPGHVVPPGTVIAGRYEVVHALGCGGMGTVYEVEHVNTKARHALKILSQAIEERAVERFVLEAQVPSRLHTDYVARVTDAGVAPEADGAPFFVMDLLRGMDLERRIEQRGPIPPAEVAHLAGQLGHALQAAHAIGIVHRDIKPPNLFLHQPFDGAPILKVLDFGIAHLGARAIRSTDADQVLGTPLYMAPEQVTATSEIGPATDVWAVGLVLFTMLAGRPYWSAPTMPQLLAQLLVQPMPPPRALVPSLPVGFDAWFARSCDRDPSRRFRGIDAQIASFQELLRGDGAVASPRDPRRSRSSPPLAWAQGRGDQGRAPAARCGGDGRRALRVDGAG